jgi:hypothetical protein
MNTATNGYFAMDNGYSSGTSGVGILGLKKKTKGNTRKAANLSGNIRIRFFYDRINPYFSVVTELRRYFRAAEEAANEVIMEQMQVKQALEISAAEAHKLDDEDSAVAAINAQTNNMADLVNSSGKSVYSPSRLIALQLANSNPLFRYHHNYLLLFDTFNQNNFYFHS